MPHAHLTLIPVSLCVGLSRKLTVCGTGRVEVFYCAHVIINIKKEKIYSMSVTVRIPTPLRRLTQNLAEVETEGANIEGIIDNLEASYPGMKERLCDEGGNIRRFVNIYLNDEDIRFLDGKATPVTDGAEISIIPAIAGGFF